MKKAGAEVGLFELDKIDEAFVAEAKAVVFGRTDLLCRYLLADEEVL